MLGASVATMAEEQDDPTLMIGAYNLLAGTLYYFGDIVTGHQYAMRGVQLWRSGSVQSHAGELELHGVVYLFILARRRYSSGISKPASRCVSDGYRCWRDLN
jgi:hypothetical protein